MNGNESDASEELKNKIKFLNADYLILDLSTPDVNTINKLAQMAYEILGLMSFFTTGEDETRAWTIKNGTKAPQAAGEIHSDFEKKFIKAEVIDYYKLIENSSWSNAKQKGFLRLEGKEYIVKNNDVMVIKHG